MDGDTIRATFGGIEYAVRYIGMDTPETVHPSQPVEWMGREASNANSQLVAGRSVILETDVSETDRYGRLLRFVWLKDGNDWMLVNAELLRLGFAQVSTYPPDVKYVDLFLEAERTARDDGFGLWGDEPAEQPTRTPTPTPDRTAKPQPTSQPPPQANCDPSYPTICIPANSVDLDCGEIPYDDFVVIGSDPHGFDGDNDGIGCET